MRQPTTPPTTEPRRVLVVEDEPGIQRAVQLVLEDWQTVPAMTLAEARAVIATPTTFDVALVDKNLPDGSGLELARELRARRPEIAVIVMTAYPTMESAIEAVATGVFDYLPKPFDASALQLKVNNAGDRVRLEREHTRMQDRIRRAETLELVGQLAGGFAHDFNNLLVVLYTAVDQLRPTIAAIEGAPGRNATTWLEEVKTTSERAADLAQRMLGMSKRPLGAAEVIDLNEVIADARVLLDRTIEANINFEIVTCKDRPTARIGRGALEQILLNLALNARDAMPRGGTLTIATARAGNDDAIPAPPKVLLTVADTGTGIPPDVVGRIFEPFFTTKGPARGTGLGLATVQRLVEDAGGTIDVESVLGTGTTFTVTLPGCSELASGPVRQPARAMPARGERVLLIEDHPGARASIASMLTTGGYKVVPVGSGREARSVAREQAFDLIIADLMVTDANGLELVGELRTANSKCRAICISGYGAEGVTARRASGERVRFLAKPFTAEQLLAVVRKVLDA